MPRLVSTLNPGERGTTWAKCLPFSEGPRLRLRRLWRAILSAFQLHFSSLKATIPETQGIPTPLTLDLIIKHDSPFRLKPPAVLDVFF